MTLETFRELTADIQREFSPLTGAVAHCRGPGKPTITICCSVFRNTGFMAENCLVW